MAELIDKYAFIEDIKTEIMNLAMDGLKGTPRDRSYLYEMIDRINEQPTVTEAEIRAKAIADFVEHINLPLTTEEDIAKILEQLKEE